MAKDRIDRDELASKLVETASARKTRCERWRR